MTNKNGFTLIELLAVIVIFAITFMFILPSITSLVKKGESKEIELIEERVIVAAKEYANNVDKTFYEAFINIGDTNYIYESDLISSNLISESEIQKLTGFVRVKCELAANEKLIYTIEYTN